MKNIIKKLSVLMITGLFVLVGCAPGGDSNNAGTNEKFIVGMECAYAPYNWTTSTPTNTSVDIGNGQYCDGFDVVVAKKIADGLGKELVIQKTAWDGLIPSLQTNQIDAIIAGMSPTDERKKEISFSDIYYRGKFGVVVKTDGNYADAKTVDDFAGAKVTAQLGTFHVDLMPQLTGSTALPPMKDFPTMTVATKSGEVDAFLSDDATGPTIDEENDDLSFIILDGDKGLQVDPEQTGVAIGLRKEDTELTADVNKILAGMTAQEIDGYMAAATDRQPEEEAVTEEESTETPAIVSATNTEGKFIVGMECAYAPYNWTTSKPTDTSVDLGNGQYCDGFDVIVARQIAEGINKELVIQKTSWDGLIPSLQSNQIDAIIAGMSPTEERKKEISFSDVYYSGKFGVIVKANGAYADAKTVADFESAKITAQLGTFHVDLISQLTGATELPPMKDFPTMTVAAKSGEIDGFISDDATGPTIVAENDDLEYVILDGANGLKVNPEQAGVGVGLRKTDTELLADVNAILASIPEAKMEEYMAAATAGQPDEEAEVEEAKPTFFAQVGELWQTYHQMFINGTLITLLISVVATALGFLLGLLMAIIRNTKVGKYFVTLYVTVIRGTPMMVQAMVIFYGTAFAISGFQWSNIPNGKTIAGILIVTINTGAYMTETIRSGIQALDVGQFEAARSLGFTKWQTMTDIILPQAIRNILPALGNEFIVNIKDTSVLNVIGVVELFFMSSSVSGATYKFFPTFAITAMIYLFLTTIFSLILNYAEKNFGKVKKSKATSLPGSQTDQHFVNHNQHKHSNGSNK